jgi:pimeloyl-ACP methyl ester carboxylesterase
MLCYRLTGVGTPLLLIHGWGVTYAIWQNLAPLLTPYFQLIMIELPGVGGSPEVDPDKPYYQVCANAIEEVRQELGIKQWSLLAYSSGTRAAEAYLQSYPQSIVQAVFLCPIYLPEIWAFLLRVLDTAHPPILTQWIFSDWRLYSLIRVFGFNWKCHAYTRVWKSEIELQPLNILVRSLCEMPGNGGAPFELPAVPTLFIWGRYDALVRRPRRLRPNDIIIPADHSAPMLAASNIAEVVIPFLTEGKLFSSASSQKHAQRVREKSKARSKARKRAHLLNLLLRIERRRFLRGIRKRL